MKLKVDNVAFANLSGSFSGSVSTLYFEKFGGCLYMEHNSTCL